MRARRAAGALALCGALVAGLAACGIEPTEVVEVGRPAQGVKRPGEPVKEARLYFAFPGLAGGLQPVSRPAREGVSAEEAVLLLLHGPNEAERMRGLFSEVPKSGGRIEVGTAQGRVTIQLPLDVARLTVTARRQLVCTAAHNRVPGGLPPERIEVDLVGGGRKVTGQTCENSYVVPMVDHLPTPARTPAPART
ncbi:hypothetical protein [Streptomyces cinnamoneus]|uniref:hypothetical protein n=1 Tax=Streptomyces cinnamoneus TaxID=53446 RepID=UPI00378AE450